MGRKKQVKEGYECRIGKTAVKGIPAEAERSLPINIPSLLINRLPFTAKYDDKSFSDIMFSLLNPMARIVTLLIVRRVKIFSQGISRALYHELQENKMGLNDLAFRLLVQPFSVYKHNTWNKTTAMSNKGDDVYFAEGKRGPRPLPRWNRLCDK